MLIRKSYIVKIIYFVNTEKVSHVLAISDRWQRFWTINTTRQYKIGVGDTSRSPETGQEVESARVNGCPAGQSRLLQGNHCLRENTHQKEPGHQPVTEETVVHQEGDDTRQHQQIYRNECRIPASIYSNTILCQGQSQGGF